MPSIPEGVKRVVERLKTEYSPYLKIERSKAGKYLLYEYKRDKESGKADRSRVVYLGIITEDGILVPARHREKEKKEEKINTDKNADSKPSEYDLKILRYLSMNGRAPVQKIAKFAGLKNSVTEYAIKKLEKRYDIKYLPEIDMTKIRFTGFISFVRFKGKAPSISEIKMALEGIPEVQQVLATTGDYHLAIYLFSMNNNLLDRLIYFIMSATDMKKYDTEWYTTPSSITYGFIPLRDKFFDLLGQITWKKTKESTKPAPGELTDKEVALMRDMNKNGTTTFAEVDQNNRLNIGTSRFIYQRLVDKGIIKRITINITRHEKYNVILIVKITNGEMYDNSRINFFSEIINATHGVTNRYSISTVTFYPTSILLFTQISEESELEDIKREIISKTKGIEISELRISNIILGSICYRNFDSMYTLQYQITQTGKNLPPVNKEGYT